MKRPEGTTTRWTRHGPRAVRTAGTHAPKYSSRTGPTTRPDPDARPRAPETARPPRPGDPRPSSAVAAPPTPSRP